MDIASVFVLSVFVEGFIDYFIKPNATQPQPWLRYVSSGIGILIAVAYHVDLLAQLGVVSAYPFIGSVMTGFVIGRGSNYLNDFLSKVKAPSITPEG